jgi:uncharacterized protein (TIGR03437 family)
MKRVAWLFTACLSAWAQGPTVTPTTVPTFTYTMNSGIFPAAQSVKVSLPASIATLPVSVGSVTAGSVVCSGVPPCGWLEVTPALGNAPLTLSVSVNPTGMTPGNYAGSFVVDTVPSSGALAVKVTVNLQISNPPSQLVVSKSALNFMYTSGSDASTLTSAEVDVSSTGDIIPFNVTIANAKGSGSGTTAIWLRVSTTSPTQGAGTATSGSAGVGSLVPIYVTLDYATLTGLAIGQYNATITITPATSNSKLNTPQTVSVGLVVSAGAPTVSAIFPQSLVPAQPTDPVFTIYGSNFTANTSVFLEVYVGLDIDISYQITTDRLTLVSPQILQAKVPTADLPVVPAGYAYPYACTFHVKNGSFSEATASFVVTNPSSPSISFLVNAASYLAMSKFNGDGTASDPAVSPTKVAYPSTAVSPRGVISIFGQNLGPSKASTATPIACSGGQGQCYGTKWPAVATSGVPIIQVAFTLWDPTTTKMMTYYAPILMTSINQINAIVPWEVGNILQDPTRPPTATVKVLSGSISSAAYSVTVLAEDPGIFTFGGLGQGQGAVINYDANGAATINSSTNQEPRGDIIAIYATGLGMLADVNTGTMLPDGALTSDQTQLADESNVQVFIGGQPAVVQYAGTSPGAVAGLVQINAIVPPTATTGVVPITLAIGASPVSRAAQSGVTIGVKK